MFLSRKMKRKKMSPEEADAIMEKAKKEAPLELEKGDLTAMLLAGFLVFMPFILLIAGALGALYWFIFFIWGA